MMAFRKSSDLNLDVPITGEEIVMVATRFGLLVLKGLLGLGSLLLVGTALLTAADPPAAAVDPVAVRGTPGGASVRLATRIDEAIEAGWAAEHITPAPRSSDAEFLRRVSLDIAGRIPTVNETRRFLDNPAADKRRRLIDNLLESPGYLTNFAAMWRRALIPEAASNLRTRYLIPGFEGWLRLQLADNVPYDQFARKLLTASQTNSSQRRFNPYAGRLSPIAFYYAKQNKPENLAAATARVFLGVRIECAQCHDHPFDSWKREQFWRFAAFFNRPPIQRRGTRSATLKIVRKLFERHEIKIPKTDKIVAAAFLDDSKPRWNLKNESTDVLANWVTARDNPYFSRAAVNRIWAHFFGRGLVDPVDDFGTSNPPSHPRLLDELSRSFIDSGFDLKFLIRAIVLSRTYQLSSRKTRPGPERPRLFSRMAVRGLSAEQVYDSLSRAIGRFEPYRGTRSYYTRNSPRQQFLSLFRNSSDKPTERQTSILQALAMMNGRLTASATDVSGSRTLAAVTLFPGFQTSAQRIEALYLATLNRRPRADELAGLVRYVDGGGPAKKSNKALSDLFWALLNSSEFLLNH